ncbi:Glycosyltransferase KanE [Planctomycetales bacterium 10988]|nr:Glycosyltransferase KanE [Planctomycetales bacterium 10988]
MTKENKKDAKREELRVLILAGALEPRGSSAYTWRLAEALMARGIEVQILCQRSQGCSLLRQKNIPLIEYTGLDWPFLRFWMVRALRKRAAEFRPDLIHIQTHHLLPLGQWLSQSWKIPEVLTVHNILDHPTSMRFLPTYGGKIITISRAVRNHLLERIQIPESLVQVIYSGVKIPPMDHCAERPKEHVPVVGTAGPLESTKGQDYFLRAAQLVKKAGFDVEFLIAGRGPDEASLRGLANELKLTRQVTFVPYLQEYREALEAMDIFCLPSLQQGLGTVMFEAMALSKPVIATGVGGVSDALTDNENGLIVESHNPQALAEKIIYLLKNRAEVQRLGQAGRKLVEERFGLDRMAEETLEVYREVLPYVDKKASPKKEKAS